MNQKLSPLLVLLLLARVTLAQHQVPIGSTSNTIALTISNSSHLPLPDLTLSITNHPSWITMAASQIQLPMLLGNSHQEVIFSFSVDPAAPVGEVGAVMFDIRSVWGTSWTKQINLTTIAAASAGLQQNYPNPFNPSTKIRFALPSDGKVSLRVFDLLGREIQTLVNDFMTAGAHEVSFDAGGLPSGLYFYRLDAGGKSTVKKMLLTR